MRKRSLMLIVFAGAVCPAFAQIPTDDADFTFGGRGTVAFEKQLSSSWYAFSEAELRASGRIAVDSRAQVLAGVDWQPLSWLEVSASYTFIEKITNRTDLSPRHRGTVDATLKYKDGPWRLSLREQFQLTHRYGDINTWNNPRNAIALKSRAKLTYKIDKRRMPYAFVELKTALNAPTLAEFDYNPLIRRYVRPDGEVYGDPGWMLDGFEDVYLSRVRGCVGYQLKFRKRNIYKVYVLADYRYDKSYKFTKDGTAIRSLVNTQDYIATVGFKYTRVLR